MWIRRSCWWGHVSSQGQSSLLMETGNFLGLQISLTRKYIPQTDTCQSRFCFCQICLLRSRSVCIAFYLRSSSFNHECDWCSHEADWSFNSCQLPAHTRYPSSLLEQMAITFQLWKSSLYKHKDRVAQPLISFLIDLVSGGSEGRFFQAACHVPGLCENH